VDYFALFRDQTFWSGFFANLLSTIAGIILAIPVGFAIDRRIQGIEHESQLARERQHQRRMTNTILGAVVQELRKNLSLLKNIKDKLPRETVHDNLILSSWGTASKIALESIQDYMLVRNIEEVYAGLHSISRALNAQFEMQYSVVVALDNYDELRGGLVSDTEVE